MYREYKYTEKYDKNTTLYIKSNFANIQLMLPGSTQFLLRGDAPIPQKYSQAHPTTFIFRPRNVYISKIPTIRPTTRFTWVESRQLAIYMINPSFPSCSPPHGHIERICFHYHTYVFSSKWSYGRLVIFEKSSKSGVGSFCIFFSK